MAAKKDPLERKMKKRANLPKPGGRFYKGFMGFFAIIFGLFLLFAFLTYHPLDPSLNTLSDVTPRNLMRSLGSIFADGFYQFLGGARYFFLVYLLSIGVRLMPRKLYQYGLWNFFASLVACMFALVSLSFLEGFLRGGTWGVFILGPVYGGYNAIGFLISQYVQDDALLTVCALCLSMAGILAGIWSLGLKVSHILDLWRRFQGVHLRPKLKEEPKTPKFAPVLKPGKDASLPQEPTLPIFSMEEFSYDSSVKEKTTERNTPEGKIRVAQNYLLPPLNLLEVPVALKNMPHQSQDVLQKRAGELFNVLEEFGIRGRIVGVRPGPVVTLFELEPAAGTKSSRVIGLADDIARSMSAVSARVAVVPGKNVIGIELPNPARETVYLRELLGHPLYDASTFSLSLVLGKDIGGSPMIADLARMPHLLVAGTTGSGKSVSVNAMILSLLYRLPPEKCKFIMIDPKMLELSVYDGIPHLLAPVVTDPKKAVVALKWTVREMENRYKAMSRLGVRNIDGYNQKLKEAQEKGETLVRKVQTGFDRETGQPVFEDQALDFTPLPFIVVVVDEMADLMLVAGKDIEAAVQRLAQMARAAGIHLIMATQRPSVDVITGTIKANFPTRISFQVTSKIDSRTILAEQGAEQLLGQGDMLYMVGGGRITRVHGAFVSDQEVERVVGFLKTQAQPAYIEGLTEEDEGMDLSGETSANQERDDLYRRAVEIVLGDGKASTSYIQRKLQIGYNRAARLIEQMEEDGIISSPNHVGKREILGGGN